MTTVQSPGVPPVTTGVYPPAPDLRQLAETTFEKGAVIAAFERELESVRAARRFVSGVVGPDAEVTDLAALVASELCANAVLHGGTPFAVGVSTEVGRVRLSVGDLNPVRPVLVPASVSSQTGRGLLLVAALSEAWGCDPWSTGKVVWAELSPA